MVWNDAVNQTVIEDTGFFVTNPNPVQLQTCMRIFNKAGQEIWKDLDHEDGGGFLFSSTLRKGTPGSKCLGKRGMVHDKQKIVDRLGDDRCHFACGRCSPTIRILRLIRSFTVWK